jgi:hypothetical protein
MSESTGQTLENHKQIIPLYHYFLLSLALATMIGSFVNLTEAILHKEGIYSAALICAISIASLLAFLMLRSFALKAQDRAIRAEENFRHYVLTGQVMDQKIHIRQVIALRFAPDQEMPALAKRAVTENMKAAEIKKAIKSWKGDYYRA